MGEITSFFVYGTLKSGPGGNWLFDRVARHETDSQKGSTRGRLFDLGPFPAMIEGSGEVLGEIITVDKEDLPPLLFAIDQIEGYYEDSPRNSLYIRKEIDVLSEEGKIVRCWAYFMADERNLIGAREILDGNW